MAFLLAQNDTISIIHSDKFIIYKNSSAESTILKDIEIVTDAQGDCEPSQSTEQEEISCENGAEEMEVEGAQETKPSQDTKQDVGAICCCLSSCGLILAVADHAKRLTIWKSTPENCWSMISTRQTARKCIRIRFTHSKEFLLAADRAGDVYSFSLTDPLEAGQLLMGHLSMLLDLVITRDDKYIITSDRDEKIRVSHFPNAYNIQSYCLGHSEFVSSLCLCEMNTDWIISGSGDGTLRIWNFKAGLELYVHKYMPDISSHLKNMEDATSETTKENPSCQRIPAVKAIESATQYGAVAVLFDKTPCLGVYEIKIQEKAPTLRLVQVIASSCEPWDMAFDSFSQLLTLVSTQNQVLNVYKLSDNAHSKLQILPSEEDLPSQKKLNELLCYHWESLKDCKRIDDLQHLYKHWYDNVEAYLEKKKNRQTAKLNKSKKNFKKFKLDTNNK